MNTNIKPILGLLLIPLFGAAIIQAEPCVKENLEKSETSSSNTTAVVKVENLDVDISMDLPQMIDQSLLEKAREEKAASEAIHALNQALLKAMADYPIREASFPSVPDVNGHNILRAKPEDPKHP